MDHQRTRLFLMGKEKAECVIFIWAQKKKATSGTKRRKELTRDRYASDILFIGPKRQAVL